MKIDLDYKSGGWLFFRISADGKEQFFFLLEKVKKIPVVKYYPKTKLYRTSIFYFDYIVDMCNRNGIDLFCSNLTLNSNKRLQRRIKRIAKSRKRKDFKSALWTSDKELRPYHYQNIGINTCYAAKRFLLGDEMGLGKTIEAIGLICKAFEDGYDKALIVVMNKLKPQWKAEVLKFTKLKPEDVSIVDSSIRNCICGKGVKPNFRSRECKDCPEYEKCRYENSSGQKIREHQVNAGRVVIINYEIMKQMLPVLKKAGFDVLILDEATRIKNVSIPTSKACIELSESCRTDAIRVAMSGTFIENRLEELLGPFTFVDRRILGEAYNFRDQYLVKDWFGKVIGYKNEKRLKRIIKDWMLRRTVDKVWKDRPPLVENNRICEMSEEHSKLYDDAKSNALSDLKDMETVQKVNAASIGALINYLIQMCDSPESIFEEFKGGCKLDMLNQIVTEEVARSKKIIIFSFFANKIIPLIMRELKEANVGKAVKIVGGMSSAKSEAAKKEFTHGDARFLVCSDSMSYGGNLQCAEYVINFDLPWNPAVVDQRIRRAYRRGQTKTVTVINLVTTGTVEDNILQTIYDKRNLFDEFIGYGKKAMPKPTVKQLLSLLK